LYRAPSQADILSRIRWLDELAQAIGQAQRLAWRLGVEDGDCVEARELYARLEAARSEVEALRYGDWVDVRKEADPAWLASLLGTSAMLGEMS
jgi:hypothetical protein